VLTGLSLNQCKFKDKNERFKNFVICSLAISSVFHLGFLAVMGRGVYYQHYIPLVIPLIALISLQLDQNPLAEYIKGNALSLVKYFISFFIVYLVCFPVYMDHRFLNQLERTGGVGYYSNAINLVSELLLQTPKDTVVLYPSWGYWMGVMIGNGGERRTKFFNDYDELWKFLGEKSKSKMILIDSVEKYETLLNGIDREHYRPVFYKLKDMIGNETILFVELNPD